MSTNRPLRLRRALLGSLLLLAGAIPCGAHPLAPSLLDLREDGAGRVTVLFRRPLLLPAGAHLQAVLPAQCRPAAPPAEAVEDSAVVERWTADCGRTGLTGGRIEVKGLDVAASDALLHATLADGRTVQTVLRPGAADFVLPARQQAAGVAWSYLSLGVSHLLTGWDHLAFVFGLLLLVAAPRRLLGTVTAFTLGHSVTLSLAALGFVRIPPAPVEVLIALSILVLAAELCRDRPSVLGRRPWLMAAGFGLLHGLGFAGALAQVGLPAREIPLALLSFNAGIEIAQIAFIAVLLGLGLAVRPLLDRLPTWRAALPAYAIGTLAAYWTFERLATVLA